MSRTYVVTGGAGFVGSNYVARLIQRKEKVIVLDNLSRAGARLNLEWLRETYGEQSFQLVIGDVRNPELVNETMRRADVIIHLAAQVAVTTSVTHPREDFEINSIGTFNVLEAARASRRNPVVIYASTNKVYGGMEDVRVVERDGCYGYEDLLMGTAESQPLDFHSPYGCSKGCGDQYVRDYFRIYNIPTVVFRQSCIYGCRQFGIEDQGWVAWFIIAAATDKPITIYGDGKQVRDILFVDDLLDVYDAALNRIDRAAGQVFNIGGGPNKTLSIWAQFGPLLERLFGHSLPVKWGDWRPGDQHVYISDIRKAEKELGWSPRVGVEEGVGRLYDWVKANQNLFKES